jgi:hypothetical protein
MEPLAPLRNGTNRNGDGRDASGRFVKGWKGGPGNPHGKQLAQFRALVYECTTEDDFCAVWRRVMRQAKRGHLESQKLFLSYTAGRPAWGGLLTTDDDKDDAHD